MQLNQLLKNNQAAQRVRPQKLTRKVKRTHHIDVSFERQRIIVGHTKVYFLKLIALYNNMFFVDLILSHIIRLICLSQKL